MKRILVCGGRDFGRINPKQVMNHPKRMAERKKLRETLDGLRKEFGNFVLIHGGAKGADALAAAWGDTYALRVLPFPADWSNVARPGAVIKIDRLGRKYDVLAGHVRNQRMVDEGKPDIVVAFEGGTGTADMVSRARKAGIFIMEIK